MQQHFSKIISISLRLLTLISKFLFVFYISKDFSPEFLGKYSIFTTTILLSVFIVGVDYYTYTTRKIINSTDEKSITLEIAHQFVFYFLSFSICTASLVILFNFINIIEKKYYLLFFLILLFEHLSQELYRLFNTIKRVDIANLILFIRSGIWVLILIILNEFSTFQLSIELIYLMWLVFSGFSVLIGFLILKREYNIFKINIKDLSISNILTGIKTSYVFFVGTILYKIVEYSNRYFIETTQGYTETGIYAFYSNISNVQVTIIDVMIFSFSYPKIIKICKENNKDLSPYIKTLQHKILFLSILISLGLLLFTKILFIYYPVFNPYASNILLLPILLFGSIMLNSSLLYHYAIYAREDDFFLLKSMVVTCLLNISVNYLFVPLWGIMGAAIAQLITFSFLFIIKFQFFRVLIKNDN